MNLEEYVKNSCYRKPYNLIGWYRMSPVHWEPNQLSQDCRGGEDPTQWGDQETFAEAIESYQECALLTAEVTEEGF